METYKANYYFHKAFTLLFSIAFLGTSIMGLINPSNLTVRHNDQIVETNFINLLPFIIMGGLTTILFIWMVQNYYRVTLNEDGITVIKFSGSTTIGWDNIEKINEVSWLWKNIIFKVKPKNGKTFYFLADKPTYHLSDIFGGGFQTKMAEFIHSKKEELGI